MILDDKQVTAFVRASYAHDGALGLYVDVLATTGCRPSQASRLLVSDLIADPKKPRLRMPRSGKGGSKDRVARKAKRYNVAITSALALKLKAAAKGRAPDALLLTQADGTSWGERPSANYRYVVPDIIKALKLDDIRPDVKTSLYALRHSSIVRRLLRGDPLRVIAGAYDTSAHEIERHYSAYLNETEHADDINRRGLLDCDEPIDNVIALAS